MKALVVATILLMGVGANAQTIEENIRGTGVTLAITLCDAPVGVNDQRINTCAYEGASQASKYLLREGVEKIKTLTSCKIWSDLAGLNRKAMEADSIFGVTASGISGMQRLVDGACAKSKAQVAVNEDKGHALGALMAEVLLSPMGPTISLILTSNRIAHEVSPDRLRRQLDDWVTKPGDAFKNSDIGRSDVGKVISGIFGF